MVNIDVYKAMGPRTIEDEILLCTEFQNLVSRGLVTSKQGACKISQIFKNFNKVRSFERVIC